MRRIIIGENQITVFSSYVETKLPDGEISYFHPPTESEEFRGYANMFGYVDPMQFGLEHDVAHTWLSVETGKPYSDVVYASAHGEVRDKALLIYDMEEHLVNRMLNYINTGKVDEDFGMLKHEFGIELPDVAVRLWRTLRAREIA